MENQKLVQDYVSGWKEGNPEKILSTLSKDCVIIESHGPTYKGKKITSDWISEWIYHGNSVDRWDITSFFGIDNVVFIEWIFECTFEKEKHYLEGISVIKIKENKICYIREYRTTKKRFLYK